MKARVFVRWHAEHGFALLEAIAAIALMGVVLSSLAILTAQWLPAWDRVYDRVQRSESLAVALDRAADDIAAAQYIPVGGASKAVLFEGSGRAVTFVRRATGPNLERGLELVRIGDALDRRGPAVARSRVPFVPGVLDVDPASAPVVLLRRPFRLGFEFSAGGGVWRTDWQHEEALPAVVRIAIADGSGRQMLTRIVAVHVQQAPPDGCAGSACATDLPAGAHREPGDEAPSEEQAATERLQ